jgi:hypothetical protein
MASTLTFKLVTADGAPAEPPSFTTVMSVQASFPAKRNPMYVNSPVWVDFLTRLGVDFVLAAHDD